MDRRIVHLSLVVRDYDEAIAFFVGTLKFHLIEDKWLSESKRWVLVSPSAEASCCLLLAKAANEEQLSRVGNQTGGRVFLFMNTDDFWRDYNAFSSAGVEFVRQPIEEPYGVVAVFRDLYGNLWDLIGHGARSKVHEE